MVYFHCVILSSLSTANYNTLRMWTRQRDPNEIPSQPFHLARAALGNLHRIASQVTGEFQIQVYAGSVFEQAPLARCILYFGRCLDPGPSYRIGHCWQDHVGKRVSLQTLNSQ